MLSRCVRPLRLSFLVAFPLRHLSAGADVQPPALPPSPGNDSSVPLPAVDYLVDYCNLPRSKALKAAKQLPNNFDSTLKPDAVLAFLRRVGLSDADIAAAVSVEPRILYADVEATLAPKVTELAELGFSPAQTAELLVVASRGFLSSRLVDNVRFILKLFGSKEIVLRAARKNYFLLTTSIETNIAPNVTLLRECGLSAQHIAKLAHCWMLTCRPEAVQALIARVDELGMPRGTWKYINALCAVSGITKANFILRLAFIRELGWSETEVLGMIQCRPELLNLSADKLQRTVEFLVETVGLDRKCIAKQVTLLTYSLEKRMIPRYKVMKALWEMGLSKSQFYSAIVLAEDNFLKKFVHPYEGKIAGLADTYAAAKLHANAG